MTASDESVENDRASFSDRCAGCGECDDGGDGDLVFLDLHILSILLKYRVNQYLWLLYVPTL